MMRTCNAENQVTFTMNPHAEHVWDGKYKIPWDDPVFSRRMLREHLNQDHDMASRRFEWIDKQVAWIHGTTLSRQPSRILDLGCGPEYNQGVVRRRLAGPVLRGRIQRDVSLP